MQNGFEWLHNLPKITFSVNLPSNLPYLKYRHPCKQQLAHLLVCSMTQTSSTPSFYWILPYINSTILQNKLKLETKWWISPKYRHPPKKGKVCDLWFLTWGYTENCKISSSVYYSSQNPVMRDIPEQLHHLIGQINLSSTLDGPCVCM